LKTPVVLAFPSSTFAFQQRLLQVIRKMTSNKSEILVEDGFIVCSTNEPVELALKLENTFGIQKVALARKVATEFAKLIEAITDIGSKVVLPGEKFFIKVKSGNDKNSNSSNIHSYRSRDIEFAATGELTAKLAEIGSRPVKSEQKADRVISTFVGKKSAYVCLQIRNGPGGLPSGSLDNILCALHDFLSFLSCLRAAKAGFQPETILLYSGETELMQNAKLMQTLAEKAGFKEQILKVAPININGVDGNNDSNNNTAIFSLLKDAISAKVLFNQPNLRIALPFSPATHPFWFIESIMQEATSAEKIPYMPLMFAEENNHHNYVNELTTSERNNQELFDTLTKGKFQQYHKIVDDSARTSLKSMKELRIHVGPNYLHQILDSI
jgi:hypothetical protein